MPRMRTITEAARYFKETDPDTSISAWTIRSLIKLGQVPHIMVGNRALIDLDRFESCLVEPQIAKNDGSKNNSSLRKINL